jgi:hypothetical protein
LCETQDESYREQCAPITHDCHLALIAIEKLIQRKAMPNISLSFQSRDRRAAEPDREAVDAVEKVHDSAAKKEAELLESNSALGSTLFALPCAGKSEKGQRCSIILAAAL